MKLVLIDASGFIHRAFHALPPLVRSDGLPVGAVHGFCEMLARVVRESGSMTHLAAIWDEGGSDYRRDIYPAYKANRPPRPTELKSQIELCRRAAEAYSVPALSVRGFEADDIIASYVAVARDRDMRIEIISVDKDLMQLVNQDVIQFCPVKRKSYAPADVLEKWGVGPELLVDLMALTGDAVDNVPGVPGIGAKIGAGLLLEFGSLDALIAGARHVSRRAAREALMLHGERALLSRCLVQLIADAPLPMALDGLRRRFGDPAALSAFLAEMEFTTLTT